MTRVAAECVMVCYQSEQLLYICPDECIDCEACVPECLVDAIFHEDTLPEHWKEYAALNAEMAKQSPNIVERQDPLEGEQCMGRRSE